MVKNMVEFKAYGGRALKIAVGMMMLVLVMARGAGLVVGYSSANPGDVSVEAAA